MAQQTEHRRFGAPDEVRGFPHGKAEIVQVGEAEIGRLVFEKMLGFANHVGLYGEETGSHGGALGNFPQAFTHLALISAAYNLDRTLGGKNW